MEDLNIEALLWILAFIMWVVLFVIWYIVRREQRLMEADYPHVEGGRDPIGRFESSLGDRSAAVRDRFYAENFLKLFPEARV